MLPLILLGVVVLGLLFNGIPEWNGSGKEISVSEFIAGLENKELGPTNVVKARFGRQILKYQDKPDSTAGWLDIWPSSATTAKSATEKAVKPENAAAKPAAPGKDEKGSATAAGIPHFYYVPLGTLGEDIPLITKLLRERKIPYTGEKPDSDMAVVMMLWLPPIILLVVIFFVFRKLTGAGAAMSFSRSRGKVFAQEDLGITFDDVAGIDEAKEELREIVGFLRSPHKYTALGGRIPRGVLLVGPPGTGKTLLAKAVAGEAGVPFFSLSGSDFVELYVGVGAARVRDMFVQAGAKAPSIIFIDELDALGKVRGSGAPGGHDERDQTLNALLVEMDGFSSDQSVIVMGATNRPETLDPALLRPGRFDRHVLVDRPDVVGREAILKVHMKKIKTADDVDVRHVAKII